MMGYIFVHQKIADIFTEENATKIDVMRDAIEDWKNKKLITENEYYIRSYS